MHWMQKMALAGLALAVSAAGASAQSFEISQNGQSVGKASLSLKQGGNGWDATSGTKIDMPGLKYSFNQTQMLDGGFHLESVKLKGSVNGTSVSVDTSAQGQQFEMKINANGQVTNTPLAFHPSAVFLPDFDPAGLQVLLNLGATNNNRDLWALVPKQTGSVAPLRVATKQDEQGTLDGRPITVHHLTVSQDTATTEVFAGPTNELLQAEWSNEGFAMVRKGFKLTPPKRPNAAPPAQPQQRPAQQPDGQGVQPQ